MPPPRSRPYVIVAVNALRAGGSQSYAFSLARLLEAEGLGVVFISKRGEWSATARAVAPVRHVLWREGVAGQRYGWAKKQTLRLTEVASRMLVRRVVRESLAVITSQPGPAQFFENGRASWPGLRHFALVHGTTPVEWPILESQRALRQIEGFFAATPEARDMLLKSVSSSDVWLIGNLFDGDLYWGRQRRSESWNPDGAVTFLGTLTPNKTKPLYALISQARELASSLVVVGGGSESGRLVKWAKECGVSDLVNFVGPCDDPRPWIERAGVMVTAGRGAIESISCGRPTVVATSDGLHGEVCKDDVEVLLNSNFTGRSARSVRDFSRIAWEVEHSRLKTVTELLELEERLSRIGATRELLRAVMAE